MTKRERDTQVLLQASQREVTRLSDLLTRIVAEKREIEQERDKWERRFDRLLETR